MAAALLATVACAGGNRPGSSSPVPESLRGYVLVVPGREPLDSALRVALRGVGFLVRSEVRGGGPPAAALVRFVFRDASAESGRWLYARFCDTRTGRVVAAAAVPLDTLPGDPGLHAQVLVQALLSAPPLDQ